MDKQTFQMPTPGRIVHYFPNVSDGQDYDVVSNGNLTGPIVGIITRIWDVNEATPEEIPLINITCFPDCGPISFKTSLNHAMRAHAHDTNGYPVKCWIYANDTIENYKI